MSRILDFQVVKKSRYETARALYIASHKLLYPVETAAIAIATFHRYACEVGDEKLQSTNFVVMASSVLFLAGKTTEHFRKISEVLLVVLRLGGYRYDTTNPDKYRQTHEALIEHEQNILRALSFETHVDLPYAFLLNISKVMDFSCQTVQFAWGLVNELILYPEFHRSRSTITPASIAVIALYIAQQTFKDDSDPKKASQWWTAFQVSNEILIDLLTLAKGLLILIDHNDDNNGKVTVSTDVDITIFSNNGKEANKESSVTE